MQSSFNLYIYILIVLLNVSTAFTQSAKIDSLKTNLINNNDGRELSDINHLIATQFYNFDYDEGIKYALTALRIAEEENYLKGKAQAFTSIGDYYYYIGDFNPALKYYHKALKISEGENLAEYPLRTYLRLSILSRTKSDFDSAAYYLQEVKKLLPEDAQNRRLASYYASCGILANYQSKNQVAIQSLRKSLKIRIALRDTARIADTWRNIGVCYVDLSAYDSASYCFSQAEDLLKQKGNAEVRMTLLLNKGEMYFAKGDINKAIENYNLALDKLQSNTYRKYYARLLYNLGELYSNQNDYNTGYSYLFKAVTEFEKLGAKQELAKTYSTIGWNYVFQENYGKAKEYSDKSLKIVLEVGDSSGISKSQNLKGFVALKTGKLTDALNYFDSAYKIRNKLGLRWGEAYTIYNQALVHIELGNINKAFELLNKALTLAESINNNSAYVYISNRLGLLFAETQDYKQAESNLNHAQEIAKAVPLASELLTNYKNYITLYELKKDKNKSLAYYKLYTSLKDSVDHIIASGRIANADALFQVKRKTDELQSKIDENILQQQKIGEQNKLIKLQKNTLTIISISLFILVSLLVAIIRLLILRSKAKEKLRRKNLDIQEQKEEILAQSEELIEANQHLEALNETLSEKNVEIEAQSNLLSEINNTLEKEVDKRTEEVSIAYKELETFFYKASHDFRRPLTTYFGLVEVAKNIVKNEQALDLFEKIRITTVGMDKMLLKLQSISDIDYKDKHVEFSLSDLLEECIHFYQKSIESKGIQITKPENTIDLKSNYSLFKIIISNLLENAILFNHPRDPKITVEWNKTEAEITLIIKDNGSGILDIVQPRIFEMFFRGNESSQGNGLGLYVTRRAVEKLEGNISFNSTINKGSTFKVKVPVEEK